MKGWSEPIALSLASDRALGTWYQSRQTGNSGFPASIGVEPVQGCVHCTTSVGNCAALWCCGKAGASNLKWQATLSDEKATSDEKAMATCDMQEGAAICRIHKSASPVSGDSVVSLHTDGGFWPDPKPYKGVTECPKNYQRLTIEQCNADFFHPPPTSVKKFYRARYQDKPYGCSAFYIDGVLRSLFWNINPTGQASTKFPLMCIPG